MGKKQSKLNNLRSTMHFQKSRNKQLEYFSNVKGYLENTNEWLLYLKGKLKKRSMIFWSRDLLKQLKKWEGLQNLSSKMAFAWDIYERQGKVPKIDQNNMCCWKESIANLETFTYEVESNPNKKALNNYLSLQKDCTLNRIISLFKASVLSYYAHVHDGVLELKPESRNRIKLVSDELTKYILDFCEIIKEVIPRFFLNIPDRIPDVDSIVRNAIISNEILPLFVLIGKEIAQDRQQQYLKGLKEITACCIESPLLKKVESEQNINYNKALENLVEITKASSLGEMHDAVAMLMKHISMILFDPLRPDKLADEDELIPAFCLIVTKSKAIDLPFYLDILTTFMDQNNLQVKDVGKGVVKLAFLVENTQGWQSFLGE